MGVDLGTNTGVCFFEDGKYTTCVVKLAKIGKHGFRDWTKYGRDIRSLIESFNPSVVAIEKIHGPSRSARNAEVRGGLLAAWESAITASGIATVEFVTVPQWKKWLTGSGKSTPDEYTAVAELFLGTRLSCDEAAAFGVAWFVSGQRQ